MVQSATFIFYPADPFIRPQPHAVTIHTSYLYLYAFVLIYLCYYLSLLSFNLISLLVIILGLVLGVSPPSPQPQLADVSQIMILYFDSNHSIFGRNAIADHLAEFGFKWMDMTGGQAAFGDGDF